MFREIGLIWRIPANRIPNHYLGGAFQSVKKHNLKAALSRLQKVARRPEVLADSSQVQGSSRAGARTRRMRARRYCGPFRPSLAGKHGP